jgi:hypothetical protein
MTTFARSHAHPLVPPAVRERTPGGGMCVCANERLRYVVTLETDSPRPHLAKYLKRVLREERLTCIHVQQQFSPATPGVLASQPRSDDSPAGVSKIINSLPKVSADVVLRSRGQTRGRCLKSNSRERHTLTRGMM